jgi:chloramphenicol-sensitive protein RarD
VFREAMTVERWIGFGVVWLALAVLTVDMLGAARRNSVAKRAKRGT